MADDNNQKPPEGWVPEGHTSLQSVTAPEGSVSEGPDENWVYESRPSQRNPVSDALTGAAAGVASKVVNPITTKALNAVSNKIAGPVPAGAPPSIYRPQPASNAVTNWVKSMHITPDHSPAAGAKEFGEAHRKMMESYEAKKKAAALQKAENLFKTEEELRKLATPVQNVIRSASSAMTPAGQSWLGKGASLAAHTAGRALAGGSAAYQGVDAYNRFQNDDYLGGTISTIGALGSGAALIPLPVTRVLGTGVGLGAEGANYLLDKYRESHQPEYTPQTIPMTVPEQKADGGLICLADGGGVAPNFSVDVRGIPDMSGMPSFNSTQAPRSAMEHMRILMDQNSQKQPNNSVFNADVRNMPSMNGMPGVGYMQTPQGAMARMQMEKELQDQSRMRAGVSAMGMAIPGQQGVKLMPGQMDVGYNTPVGAGRLDLSANRSINPMPGRGHMQGVRANYTMPFAEGGNVKKPSAGIAGVYQQVGPVKGPSLSSIFAEHMDSLPQKTEDNLRHQQDIMDRAFAGDREAMKEFTSQIPGVAGMTKVVPAVNRLNMHFKDVTKRIPQLQESAQKMLAGQGSRAEHDVLVNTHKPVLPFDFVPTPATREEAVNALQKNQKELYGVPSQTLQAGHPVGLRLDIPAYSNHGVWVPTIHEQASGFGAGKAIGHESVASVLNPQFGMSDKAALSIAGGKPKGTIATIKGNWNPVEHKVAVANAQDYLNHPEWRQVGMDPERHGYFYDRATMDPITHAEEALQIGPLVLAKKPVYGKKEDFKYSKGGLTSVKKKEIITSCNDFPPIPQRQEESREPMLVG
jgi:hypothetical protein